MFSSVQSHHQLQNVPLEMSVIKCRDKAALLACRCPPAALQPQATPFGRHSAARMKTIPLPQACSHTAEKLLCVRIEWRQTERGEDVNAKIKLKDKGEI